MDIHPQNKVVQKCRWMGGRTVRQNRFVRSSLGTSDELKWFVCDGICKKS